MGNQVKPVRFPLAGTGHSWLYCIGHALSPSDPCRTLGDARIQDPKIILKVALEWGNSGTRYLTSLMTHFCVFLVKCLSWSSNYCSTSCLYWPTFVFSWLSVYHDHQTIVPLYVPLDPLLFFLGQVLIMIIKLLFCFISLLTRFCFFLQTIVPLHVPLDSLLVFLGQVLIMIIKLLFHFMSLLTHFDFLGQVFIMSMWFNGLFRITLTLWCSTSCPCWPTFGFSWSSIYHDYQTIVLLHVPLDPLCFFLV